MYGPTIRFPHLAPREGGPFRRNTHSLLGEDKHSERVQTDQSHNDFETYTSLGFMGNLVLLLQVSQHFSILKLQLANK